MTSLSEVYTGGVGTATSRQRRLLGMGVFAAGAAMVVVAIPVATTDLAAELGLGRYEARELAGVLAGLGLPAAFVGIFAVLPAGRATRAAGAIGASLAVLGVALFSAAYPYNWLATDPALAVATTALYAAGTLVTFWCLFVGLATFTRRNDPGGSARIEITEEGKVRVVTDDDAGIPGFGSVGLFGRDPDGEVETQTNLDDEDEDDDDDGATILTASGPQDTTSDSVGDGAGATPASDGAGGVRAESGPDPAAASADVRQAVRDRGRPDEYCGNCRHFEYVRADDEIAPYCGFHDELLEDMDACDQWESNN